MVYSVLTEPTIPVLWLNGKSETISIREAFLCAHMIRDIQGDTPLEQYALLRFMIAFSMDMLHPKNSFERRELLDQGHFDISIFDDYCCMCEKDGPCFDLFDPVHPFLQSRYDNALDAKAEKPVSAIIHSLPSGNNHTFIDHRSANAHAITPDKAFRALCTSYLFCVSGTAGPSSVNNTPPLYAIVLGNNLFKTLVYNMLSESEVKPLAYGCGHVPWREFSEIRPKKTIANISLLEGLTWMPRRITLRYDPDKMVRHIYCQAGLDFKGNDLWNDPHVPKYKKKDTTYGTVKPELGRATWRDVGTLLYDHDSQFVRQPQSIRCFTNLFDDDELPYWLSIRTAGLITNKAAYICWTEDNLSLPTMLLLKQEYAAPFREGLSLVETLQSSIYSIIREHIDKPRSGSKNNEHEIALLSQEYFLQKMHDFLFATFIQEICNDSPTDIAFVHLNSSIKNTLQDMELQILNKTGTDSKSIIQQIAATRKIWSIYYKLTERKNLYVRA